MSLRNKREDSYDLMICCEIWT